MTTPGPASRYRDSVHDRNAPGVRDSLDRYVQGRPWASHEERLMDQALASAIAAPELLRQQGPPIVRMPQVSFGKSPNITDLLDLNRSYPDSSAQFTGTSGSISGSSVPSLGWW